MALFSYKEIHLGTGRSVIQLTVESGTAPMNLLGQVNEPAGLDFSEKTQEQLFRKLNANELGGFSDLAADVQSAVRAKARDVGQGRTYFVAAVADLFSPSDETIRRLREELSSQGHAMEESPRKATVHVLENESGPYLAVPGQSAIPTLNSLAECPGVKVDGVLSSDSSPLHRIVLRSGDPCEIARRLSKKEGYRVLNHTATKVLDQKPVVAVTQPYLVSARRGVEIHPCSGNISEIAALLPKGSFIEGELGSFVLKGTAEEQKEALAKLKGVITGPQPSRKLIEHVGEETPTPVLYSDAASLTAARLTEFEPVSEALKEEVRSYKMKTGRLTEPQVAGAAFALQIRRSLNADEPGAGKTLQTSVAADIKTPPGRKTLVVCPAGLIPQWVEALDKFLACSNGIPVLPENADPDWLKRLPGPSRKKLNPAWNRVNQRFVFLPESTLEGGVKYSHGALRTEKETTEAANAMGELTSILKEPISTLLIDEAQGFRVAGKKFELLDAIASGKLRGENTKIDGVIMASATPLHRDAPDLFPMLRLMGARKFAKMDLKEFCKDYCQQKVVLTAKGEREYAPPIAPYGYGMLKEGKIPEVAKVLAESMISRTKAELAPECTRRKEILSPMPYAPSASLGISIPGFEQQGEFVTLPAETTAKIAQEANHTCKRIRLAEGKVAATVADATAFLETHPKAEKIVLVSQFVGVAGSIQANLMAQGISTHLLTGKHKVNGSGTIAPTKQDLVRDFLEDPKSRVFVMTAGAGGTGVDGLHRASSTMIVNDFSVVGGIQVQAEGRVWRIEDAPVGEDAKPVSITYKVADNEMDKRDFNVLTDRRHSLEFVRQQNLMQSLDSPETKAEREMKADNFEKRILGIVGESPSLDRLRDNSYLAGKASAEEVDAQESAEALRERTPEENLAIALEIAGTTPSQGNRP